MIEASKENLAEGEERFLFARAHSVVPAESADSRFVKKLQDYFTKWGWLSSKQRFLLARVIARHADLPVERKRSTVKRICVVCKVRSIHPNDSLYERRVCIACAPNQFQVPGLAAAQTPGQPSAGSQGKIEIEEKLQGWREEANRPDWSRLRRKRKS